MRLLVKIQIVILQPTKILDFKDVILSEAKNLKFFFSSQKIKKRDPSAYSLRMTRKGKLAKILEHFLCNLLNFFTQDTSKRFKLKNFILTSRKSLNFYRLSTTIVIHWVKN
jgi:hypothetical protein